MPVNFRVVLSILLLSVSLFGCSATYYSAKPITATVVDSETKQPISDVIVVAHWELNGGLEGGNFEGNMMVMETITNANGEFHFSGWGPLSRPKGTAWGAQLKGNDPQIYLFKIGYRPGIFGNQADLEKLRENPALRASDWDGKAMPLKKFEGDLRRYADDEIFSFSLALSHTMSWRCSWTKLPRTILALQEQTKVFRAAGIDAGNFYTDLVNNDKEFRKDGCSVVDFLREHSK